MTEREKVQIHRHTAQVKSVDQSEETFQHHESHKKKKEKGHWLRTENILNDSKAFWRGNPKNLGQKGISLHQRRLYKLYGSGETVRLTAIIFPIPSQVNFVISLYYTIENVEKKSTIRYGLERLGKLQETILI